MVQVPGKVIQLFGCGGVWRTLYTDGRPVPERIFRRPLGGRHAGGHDAGARRSRLARRVGHALQYRRQDRGALAARRTRRAAADDEVNDPAYYTRPWTSAPQVYTLQRKDEPQEIIFAPSDVRNFNKTLRDPSAPQSAK
jgi:hypothetical protein